MGVVKPLAPFPPSGLRIISAPKSPVGPLSPRRAQFYSSFSPISQSPPLSPALSSLSQVLKVPPKSMPWIWSCHKCHTRYSLGATRRCLHDGHYFCGGITIDKVTGKAKKHRACASEFDYVGWEKHGKWKRDAAEQEPKNRAHQNCENQCDFPSACHWKAKRTPKKEANFNFLDPECLGSEPTARSTPSEKSGGVSSLKKTGVLVDKIVKAAEKRTAQLTTLLCTIDEEKRFASTPGYVPGSSHKSLKLKGLPPLNGLGLSFPVMDFSSSKKRIDNHDHREDKKQTSAPPVNSPTEPSASASTTTPDDSDVKMTDWLSKEPSSSSPSTPPLAPKSPINIPFNFNLDSPNEPPASSSNDKPHNSPHKSAWDGTTDDIGVALGSPIGLIYEEVWDEHSEARIDARLEREKAEWAKEDAEWEREMAAYDKKCGV